MNEMTESLKLVFPPLEFYLHAAPILSLLLGGLVALIAGVFKGNPDRPNMLAYQVGFISCFPAVIVPLLLLSAPGSFG
ncbi:hypothetical protein EBR21_11000, partial [bacterium]|nr:hypothetical protein [bacterium]